MADLVQAQRISVFLPANNRRQRVAARRVLQHIRTAFFGYTVSALDDPVFTGSWFNPRTEAVEEDRVTIAVTDVPVATDTDPMLLSAIDDIRQAMFDAYRDFGSPQADVWVTVEAVKTSS
jgi:hypothetical protein